MGATGQKKDAGAPVRCTWGHICSLSSIDKERNNISLFNIIVQWNFPQAAFDQYETSGKIVVIELVPFEIVLQWMRTIDIEGINDELPFEFRIKTFDPTGQAIQETVTPAFMPRGAKRHVLRIQTNAVPITVPGDYRIDIEVKTGEIYQNTCAIPIEIRARSA